VVAHAGKVLVRDEIAKAVVAHGAKTNEKYVVRWEGGTADVVELATSGHAFTAAKLGGGRYDFAKVLGKRPAVVTFWASWCAPCLVEAPHIQALHKAYGPRGLEVVSISIDEAKDHPALAKVVEKLKLTYPVALDPKGTVLAQYAKGSSIPLTFVLDDKGEVVHRQQNFRRGDEVELERVIADVMKKHTGR